MGEGWDGGGPLEPFPPHLNPPPPWGEEVIFSLNWGITLEDAPGLVLWYDHRTLSGTPALTMFLTPVLRKS
jgi:hypothetical protein